MFTLFLSAAWVYVSRAAGVWYSARGRTSPKAANRQQTSTAVLATTDLNLLNYGSSAVAGGTVYCRGTAVEEVWGYGGQHSSGNIGAWARFADIWLHSAATLDN